MRHVGRLVPGVVLLGLLARPVAAETPRSPEAAAVVEHQRAARLERSLELLPRLAAWAGENPELDPDLLDLVDLLDDAPLTDSTDAATLSVTAALLHGLAGDPRLEDAPFREDMLATVAGLSQEVILRLHREGSLLDLGADSLRTLGDPSRIPPPEGLPMMVAPVPPPGTDPGERVFLERADRVRAGPSDLEGDWTIWVPGRDELLFRSGGRLWSLFPDRGTAEDLGDASGDAPPTLSRNGEYVAAVDGEGFARIRRFGSAGRDWWFPFPAGLGPVTALAFAPEGLTLAAAFADGTIRLTELGGDRERADSVAAAGGTVVGLHWAPRGDAFAWDEVRDGGFLPWAGRIRVGPGPPLPPLPEERGFLLEGNPQWAPDGESVLAAGTLDGRSGVWLYGDGRADLVVETDLAPGSGVTVSPDFHRIAVLRGPEETHPAPWGTRPGTPFVFEARRPWILEVDWPTSRGGRSLVYDRTVGDNPDLAFGPTGAWLAARLDERVERLTGDDAPLARQGLWAVRVGDDTVIPLTREPARVLDPVLSWSRDWIAYRLRTGDASPGRPAPGRIEVRQLPSERSTRREAERVMLRARGLVRQRDFAEAATVLRDAVRLDPDLDEARHSLARVYLELAGQSTSSAAAGLAAGAAVTELVRLAGTRPGDMLLRRDLARAFVVYAALAGRIYSVEAQGRARAFLEADPHRETEPDRLPGVLLPALADGVLWDPGSGEAWDLVDEALAFYNRPAN